MFNGEKAIKTNLNNIINLISDLESERSRLDYKINRNAVITEHMEIETQTKTSIKNIEDIDELIAKYMEITTKIEKLKNVLSIKNTSIKIDNQRTIIEGINYIKSIRKIISIFDDLLSNSENKVRRSDGNGISAYYEITRYNFNKDKIEDYRQDLIEDIQEIENNIAKANQIEFELNI